MFITPVSIKTTKENKQFIIDELVKLGYIARSIENNNRTHILATNLAGNKNQFSDFEEGLKYEKDNNRYYCEDNVDLFLALAAMTNNEDGIEGEYWKCLETYAEPTHWTKDKLYQQVESGFTSWNIEDNTRHKNGFPSKVTFKRYFTKATKEEIKNHFNKNKALEAGIKFEQQIIGNMNKEIIGYKVKLGIDKSSVFKICGSDIRTALVPKDCDCQINSPMYKKAVEFCILDSLFEPVYKETEKIIAVQYEDGSFPVVISKDKIYCKNQDININPVELEQLIDHMHSRYVHINKHKVIVNKIDIGCHKNVNFSDIIKVYDIYKSLQ